MSIFLLEKTRQVSIRPNIGSCKRDLFPLLMVSTVPPLIMVTTDQPITRAQHHVHVLEIQVVPSYRHLLGFRLSPRNPLVIQLHHREDLGEQQQLQVLLPN